MQGINTSDKKGVTNEGSMQGKMYNKLEDNFHLSNKKALLLNMRNYYEAIGKDVFSALPVTFHIKSIDEDAEFMRFKQYYQKEEEQRIKSGDKTKNIWIVKPGENTNRGQGITVMKEFEEIKQIIVESTASKKRTCIVQKYI